MLCTLGSAPSHCFTAGLRKQEEPWAGSSARLVAKPPAGPQAASQAITQTGRQGFCTCISCATARASVEVDVEGWLASTNWVMPLQRQARMILVSVLPRTIPIKRRAKGRQVAASHALLLPRASTGGGVRLVVGKVQKGPFFHSLSSPGPKSRGMGSS